VAGIGVFQALVEPYQRPVTLQDVVGVVVVVDVDVLVVEVLVVDVLVEVVLVVGVAVIVGVVVVVDVDVVVVGGGGLVAPCTTSVGFDVVTAAPFLLLAVTTTRSVEPTSAAVSK
jgi:hypothetical protein